ncbi:TBPIP-domain-containing protein [Laetiporus sulphureus 93-53]|uniref:TBPIP-domain-containing protein n=1 Tax=Laetiporus sulphureus 93-53 TaxID=1314785 RepID=A0A165BF51_9APHY|nr:TBPIP-domain-containing protein [Laetiporus sulphureus 93-53]KZT00921.1 TBPIP-domain-containing protein [Laetiporus sulphureus 93-53]
MSAKPKASEAKAPVLKGQEAEDKVLEYIKRMNRPFGAVDVSANLKGAVPKTATQKILVALAEKGDLVQKTYGKTTFFVANQANLEDMPAEKLAALEAEHKNTEEGNKVLASEVRTLSTEVAKLRGTPTDAELATSLEEVLAAVEKARGRLQPLRAGTPLVSAAELADLDADWTKWHAEWVRRKKIFTNFWQLATDALPPQEAKELAEDLGIELDTPEHGALERGAFCSPSSVLGKRRR